MEELGLDLLENLFNGYNNTLFAYGQTGSGKTHSVIGTVDEAQPEEAGLLPRVLKRTFEQMQERTKTYGTSFKATVSYLEIYNEVLRDLLVPPGPEDPTAMPLQEKASCSVHNLPSMLPCQLPKD